MTDQHNSKNSDVPKLLHVGFNQDVGRFSVGTSNGFRIHSTDPYMEIFRLDFEGASGNGGGIGYTEMLFGSHMFALVGGGSSPQYPVNKVMMWDDHASMCVGERSFRSVVKAVKLRRDRIVVVLEQNIYVRRGTDRDEIYSLAFSLTAQWLAVSSDRGTVHVFNLNSNSGSPRGHISDQTSSVTTPRAPLSFMRRVLPKYFNSEWSVAQFHLVEGTQYITAFGHRMNTVIIIGMDGSFYRCEFDPVNGGEMTQLECHNFLKPEDSS